MIILEVVRITLKQNGQAKGYSRSCIFIESGFIIKLQGQVDCCNNKSFAAQSISQVGVVRCQLTYPRVLLVQMF